MNSSATTPASSTATELTPQQRYEAWLHSLEDSAGMPAWSQMSPASQAMWSQSVAAAPVAIKTWQERMGGAWAEMGSRAPAVNRTEKAMCAEIADLRAALQDQIVSSGLCALAHDQAKAQLEQADARIEELEAQCAALQQRQGPVLNRDAILESAVQAVAVRAGDADRISLVSAYDAIRGLKSDRQALPEQRQAPAPEPTTKAARELLDCLDGLPIDTDEASAAQLTAFDRTRSRLQKALAQQAEAAPAPAEPVAGNMLPERLRAMGLAVCAEAAAEIERLRAALQQRQAVPAGFVWPEPPKGGQSHVLFDDGYVEGWAKAIETVRAALAQQAEAAPVPAERELYEALDQWKRDNSVIGGGTLLDRLFIAGWQAHAARRSIPQGDEPAKAADAPEWIILQRPGCVPELKGPLHSKKFTEDMLRELYEIYPGCICTIAAMPRTSYPQSGREWLSMYGDKRRSKLREEETAKAAAQGDELPPPDMDGYCGEGAYSAELVRKIRDAARGTVRGDELPPLPAQPEELRARWKCEDCGGHGHTGETIPGNYFQPPEPEMCGTCQGAGWVETEALTPEQCREYGASCRAGGAKGEVVVAHLKAAREAIQRVAADLGVLHEDKPPEMAATIALTGALVSGDLELAANYIEGAIDAARSNQTGGKA